MRIRLIAATMLGLTLAGCSTVGSGGAAPATASAVKSVQVDTRYFTLPNGLKVVMSRDTLAPTVTVGTYYGIGFKLEPRNRTGFAHLFEHLMFQGSQHAPKGTLIGSVTNAGGILNGSTRFDYTNYYQIVPSNALEQVLWLDADRMARPTINTEVLENQKGVVANEVKVNVLNQPYGGWPWLDMPQLAFQNWYNAHNFYGALEDLQAATVEDAKQFFAEYYRPNNAVLVILGDIDYAQTRAMVERLYGSVPRGAKVTLPNLNEPRQAEEKFRVKKDPLAPRPAFTAAWRVPERGTPQWYAMGLLDQMLAQGQDSRLFRKLVRETGITTGLQAGTNIALGSHFTYLSPNLWTVAFVHDPSKRREEITAAVDAVIDDVRTNRVSEQELERARTKMRSSLYGTIESRTGLVDLLALSALWENDPTLVNRLEQGFNRVTPELLLATAKEYLRPTNRSVLLIEPAAATGAAKTGASR